MATSTCANTRVTTASTATVPHNNSRWLPNAARRMFQRNSSAADIISTHHNDLEGDTEFFASLETNETLAFFHREEVEAGNLLGTGTFTEIHAVSNVVLLGEEQQRGHYTKKREEIRSSVWTGATPQAQYAIKQLTAETLKEGDPKTLARAARELVNDAKYLGRLSHANIVTLRGLTLDAFGHNYLSHQFEDFFVLLDRVSDHTLADRIYKEWRADPMRGSEPEEDLIPMKANYSFQLAKALRHCHQKGVLYRDLKPTNVGFSLHDPHCVQLMDFGLARDFPVIEEDRAYRMTLAGTRRYLDGSVLATGEYTLKSDVYSWAMILYEMTSERKPYHGLTATDHQTYVCEHGDRPTLDDYYLPEELDIILTHSWHPHLSRRWSMEEVCDQMLKFLMQLDVAYYQLKEGDFLFDIEVETQVEAEEHSEWEELETDELDWRFMSSSSSSMRMVIQEEEPQHVLVSADGSSSSQEDPEMKTSLKSKESTGGSSRRASLSSLEQVVPCKIISEAA